MRFDFEPCPLYAILLMRGRLLQYLLLCHNDGGETCSDKMEVDVSSAAAAAAPTVPETLLKKRKRDEQWASIRKQQLEVSRTKNVKNRQLIFKRAEQYIKEYRSQVRENLIISRVAILFCFYLVASQVLELKLV